MKYTVKGNKKLRSHNTSYCLIEVVTKAGLNDIVTGEITSTLRSFSIWHNNRQTDRLI
jgi:hypothetical protein